MDVTEAYRGLSLIGSFSSERRREKVAKAVNGWCRNHPTRWRDQALSDLLQITGEPEGDWPSEDSVTAKTPYMTALVEGRFGNIDANRQLAQVAIFGTGEADGRVAPPCVLAEWDLFVLQCHSKAEKRETQDR